MDKGEGGTASGPHGASHQRTFPSAILATETANVTATCKSGDDSSTVTQKFTPMTSVD